MLLAAALTLALAATVAPPRPRTTPVPPKGDTPEAKLERVIQRLEFALDAAQGSPDFGVKSDALPHRLIAADRRRAALHRGGDRSDAPYGDRGQRQGARRRGPFHQAAEAAATTKAAGPQSATNVETEKFLLVYDNDRWTLPEKPESETLRSASIRRWPTSSPALRDPAR